MAACCVASPRVALCIVDPRPKGCGRHRVARPAVCLRTGSRLPLSDTGDSNIETCVTILIPTYGARLFADHKRGLRKPREPRKPLAPLTAVQAPPIENTVPGTRVKTQ
jgi:hypothetical protein